MMSVRDVAAHNSGAKMGDDGGIIGDTSRRMAKAGIHMRMKFRSMDGA